MSDTNFTFTERKAGRNCPMCPDDHRDDVVAELPSGLVHLQNDGDYRGYCILIFQRHAVELYELSPEERAHWINDIAAIEQAVTDLCAPAKLNVTMLGNMVPHLHCHIIPRYTADPEWGHPPAYRPPSERNLLSPDAYRQLLTDLKAKLNLPLT